MILHTVSKSPQNPALSSCLRVASEDSAILLIEDGVFAAIDTRDKSALIQQALSRHRVYALEADLKARGLMDKLATGVELVDYAGFVELTERYQTVQSWY